MSNGSRVDRLRQARKDYKSTKRKNGCNSCLVKIIIAAVVVAGLIFGATRLFQLLF